MFQLYVLRSAVVLRLTIKIQFYVYVFILYVPNSRCLSASIASLKSVCAVCLVNVTSNLPYSCEP